MHFRLTIFLTCNMDLLGLDPMVSSEASVPASPIDIKLLEDKDCFFSAVPNVPCPEQSSLNAGALLLEGRKASLITLGEVWL